MRRAWLAVLLLCGCFNFNDDFKKCQENGQCDGGAAGGSGGGSAGGTAGGMTGGGGGAAGGMAGGGATGGGSGGGGPMPLSITGVEPDVLPLDGGTVAILGSGFDDASFFIAGLVVVRVDGGSTPSRVSVAAPARPCGPVEVRATKNDAGVSRRDLLSYPCATVDFNPGFPNNTPTICPASGVTDMQLLDLNGNGTLDFVIACADGIEVYTNNGFPMPSFTTLAPVKFAAPRPFGAADLDGDGDLDLVVPSYEPKTLSLLHNDGVGGLRDAGELPIPFTGYGGTAAVLGDFDGVPGLDAVVSRHERNPVVYYGVRGLPDAGPMADAPAINGVALAAGNVVGSSPGDEVAQVGDCTLTLWQRPFASTATRLAAGPDPQDVAVGDLDGDGFDDLVVANAGGVRCFSSTDAGSVSVVRGGMNGANLEPPLPVGLAPIRVALADLNADHRLDAVVLDRTGANAVTVWVLLGRDAGFGPPASFMSTSERYLLRLADMNGDGKPDILLGNQRNTYLHENRSR